MSSQAICDHIRANFSEAEMIEILEDHGFAVHETGHELVEALCESVEQGDVSLCPAPTLAVL